jgi:uncharacterized protein YndB with AHSA1/START domain
MNNDLIATGSIEVNAPAAKVWEALTNPEIIKEYLFGTETVTDWQVGSTIYFQGRYGDNLEHSYRDGGIIKELVAHERLSYTYWSGFSGLEDKPENYSLVTYTLVPKGENVTAFTWAQEGYATQEGYEHAQSGMPAFLQQIKAIMER